MIYLSRKALQTGTIFHAFTWLTGVTFCCIGIVWMYTCVCMCMWCDAFTWATVLDRICTRKFYLVISTRRSMQFLAEKIKKRRNEAYLDDQVGVLYGISAADQRANQNNAYLMRAAGKRHRCHDTMNQGANSSRKRCFPHFCAGCWYAWYSRRSCLRQTRHDLLCLLLCGSLVHFSTFYGLHTWMFSLVTHTPTTRKSSKNRSCSRYLLEAAHDALVNVGHRLVQKAVADVYHGHLVSSSCGNLCNIDHKVQHKKSLVCAGIHNARTTAASPAWYHFPSIRHL
jgi:hypothetical protein